MKRLTLNLCLAAFVIAAGTITSIQAQETAPGGKAELVMKFRKLTGADTVNLRLNVSVEEVKAEMIAKVDDDAELTAEQKQALRRSAIEGYERLEKQVMAFLNDQTQMTKLSEAAVFEVYDKAFTEAELREAIAFYSTATGQKALKFLPTLSAQYQSTYQSMFLPKLQEFVTPISKAEGDLLDQKIREAKAVKP